MNRLKSQLHYLHVLKDAKPQARRALITSASDELIKVIVECTINTLNGISNYVQKNKPSKYNSQLRALLNPKINFKSKRKLLVQRGGFRVPLLTSILSGVIRALMNSN
jgi:hypothetical protein